MAGTYNSLLSWLRRLGNAKLPIGKPWFALLHLGAGYRFLWPVRWQGWAAAIALQVWIWGSVVFFIALEWEPDNAMFYCWLLPTVTVTALIVGVKTNMRAVNSL